MKNDQIPREISARIVLLFMVDKEEHSGVKEVGDDESPTNPPGRPKFGRRSLITPRILCAERVEVFPATGKGRLLSWRVCPQRLGFKPRAAAPRVTIIRNAKKAMTRTLRSKQTIPQKT